MDEGAKETILFEKLLQHDLARTASKLGFAAQEVEITNADAAALLNLAERYSRAADDRTRTRSLLICALLWEHRRAEWHALPAFIVYLLSRLGLDPAMPMVDSDYDRQSNKLMPLGSLALEAAVAARAISREVMVGGRHRMTLSAFQHRAWAAIETSSRVGISAPTSAGKSYVLVHKIVDILSRAPGTAAFIVPTLSLLEQVSHDIRKTAIALDLPDLQVLQSATPKGSTTSNRTAYVLTQERAWAALREPGALEGLRIAVIDEVQNIERFSDKDDDRSRILYDVIQELKTEHSDAIIVISGPRVENIGPLAKQLFGPEAVPVSDSLPPVINITYGLSNNASGPQLKQYIDSQDQTQAITLAESELIPSSLFGGRQYRQPTIDFMASIAERLSADGGTLIFSPTSRQAVKTATGLADQLKLEVSSRLDDLRQYAGETVHPEYALVRCLASGIAFHHGKMPYHIRVAVERAFRDGDVAVVACTTTLMQGVNLPAKNIIARNPHLFTRRRAHSTNLSSYDFSNLRGRAGRLMLDFVGRTIVLDEEAFIHESIGFDSGGKHVRAGYRERFEQHQAQIIADVRRNSPVQAGSQVNDLVVYVRQMVMKYGDGAAEKLRAVGIALTDPECSEVTDLMKKLQIPPSLCDALPYWDPIILDEIYKSVGKLPVLPRNPLAKGLAMSLLNIAHELRRIAPYYYDKYIGISSEQRLLSVMVSAEQWLRGVPLNEIIRWGTVTEDEIDSRIDTLNRIVSHELPKFLSPIVQIQDPKNPLLGFLEVGAYQPAIRGLIAMGLPRETALRVAARAPLMATDSDEIDVSQLRAAVEAAKDRLNLWERAHIDDVLG